MKVTRELRFRGISLRLAAVLKSPRLSVMALAMQFGEQATAQDAYRPLSLVPSDVTLARVDELLQPWEIQPSAVDDIMPTTDEQARHVALIYSAARTLLLYHTLDGSGPLAIDKLEIAIARLVARFSILRTVFMPHRNSFLQVVLKRSDTHTAVVEASNGDTLDMVCDRSVENDVVEDLLFGTCLTRFIIIHCKDQYRIVCRISHAQHDGMSIANMWTAFEALCSTDRVPRAPDNKHSFAQHMRTLAKLDTPAALSHWQRLLNKSSPTRLKAQSTCQLNFDEGPSITSTIFEQSMRSIDYTFATVLKAAWAAVLAKFCAKQDVVFGTLINGRSEADAQEILGPCSPDDDRQRLSRAGPPCYCE
ncbi:hypothetical protein DOTSEDRAFT_70458 [Dothistroma septosporum NZE10]|uniref:Condensation domain-containing protein n=1 Tax=Dothistroma septosporum (strain NZE10 / CBS 128990) TaxID=675120 RepID=N1PVS3_DOTSN|nr:hypothetical protein DOTSEDRAFT_70458 [Dothistroma septosporum NZE10]